MSKDLLYKAHITDRIELAINQIADAKSLIWTVDYMSDIVDSKGPKIIFSEKIKSPEHVPESMSVYLKPIWEEITEKDLWRDDDKVMDIYTERIITEVEAWLDSLAEKRKEQPSVKVDVSDDTPTKKTMTKSEFYSFIHNEDVQKTLMHIGDSRHLMGYLVQEKRIDGEVWFEYSCTDSMKGPYRISLTEYYNRNREKFDENPAAVLADLKEYVEHQLDGVMFLDKELHTENDANDAPTKKTMTKAEFYAFLKNKDVQKTLLHIADARHLNGYLESGVEYGEDVFLLFSPPNVDDWEEPYRISLTEYYDRNHWAFDENPELVLNDLKRYVEKKLDTFLFMDQDFHTENEAKNAEKARELNRNLFALTIMSKGANRLTRLAERRKMKVRYDGQERSVTFYKPGLKTIALAITIRMDEFVDLMSNELLSADDKDKVAWFAEYCDSTIEEHIYKQKFEVNKHSLSYIHDSIRKWCKDHDVNVTFIDEKEDPLKTGYMLFWVYKEHLVTLVIDIANNPEFAGLCYEESDYADNGLQPWNPKYAKIRTSYALVIDDAHSIIEKVINMIIAELLAPKRTIPLAKGLQEAFKNYSSKELYKSCNSVPEAWINQFIEESAYFEDFMHASINTIVELIQFIRMKEREVEEDNNHRYGDNHHGK